MKMRAGTPESIPVSVLALALNAARHSKGSVMNTTRDNPLDVERRSSERWPTEKPLRWRLRGDANPCESVVVERSLTGMVLSFYLKEPTTE